jgi:hypothetical protein
MSKISLFSVIAGSVMTLGLGAVASAQDKPADGRPPWVVACEADMKKHCEAEVKANTDVRPCLAKKETELSENCQRVFVRQYKVLEACKDDIAKHCTSGNDPASMKKCFQEKADQMSDKCKSALSKGSKAHAKAEAAAAKEPPPAAAPATAKKKVKKAPAE